MSTEMPYTFLTEDEVRYALGGSEIHDQLSVTRVGQVVVYRGDHLRTWATHHPLGLEGVRHLRGEASYSFADIEGHWHTFPVTADQLNALVCAAQDLNTRPSDVLARLIHDAGASKPLMMSDGTLTSGDRGTYPYASPFQAVLDPQFLGLMMDEVDFEYDV